LSDTNNTRGQFGNRLRALREDAGLNGKQLAELLGWAQSKVSRIETGKQTASAEDVKAWVETLKAPPEVLANLLADLRTVRFEYAAWRRQLRAGTAPRQRASIGLEATATTVRAFETAMIPGLLQTPDYAHRVFANLASLHHTPNDADEGVRARLRRQEALYDHRKSFRFLLTEAALRYRPGPAVILLGQLDRLIVLSDLETIELAVLPFEAQLPTPLSHGFWIFDDQLVLVETLNAELALRDDEVAFYVRIFETLWELGAHGDKAKGLIGRAISELRNETT
jgi:transcriptional regulator with XRE-family HTH domain